MIILLFLFQSNNKSPICLAITDKPVHAVTSIQQSSFYCTVIEHFIWIWSLLIGHLSYKTTLSLFQRWVINTGLTVYNMETWVEDTEGANRLLCIRCIIFDLCRCMYVAIGDVTNATCIAYGLALSLIVSKNVSISIESRRARQQFPYRGG